jgi:serine/threonine protein phosphatase PrpC
MKPAPLDIGIAHYALPGESESGDRCVVRTSKQRTLIGVIDGLGHGHEAAAAAAAAAEVLESFAGEPVGSLLERCHARLRGTRGAAITLIVIDADVTAAEWVGVGNVAVAVWKAATSGKSTCRELLVRSGIAGSSLPSARALRLPLDSGDMVLLATDGVDPRFIESVEAVAGNEPAQCIADIILAGFVTKRDDALVVVARLRE